MARRRRCTPQGSVEPAGSLVTSCLFASWTSAARSRRSTRPCRGRSPRAQTVHDVVARILGEVRREGDRAVVRNTAELDEVDVSDGLRVPEREIEEARAGVHHDLYRALEVAFGRILAYHGHEGRPARRPGRRRCHASAT